MAQAPQNSETGCLTVKAPGNLVDHLDTLARLTGQPRSVLIRFALAKLTADDLPAGWIASGEATRSARRVNS